MTRRTRKWMAAVLGASVAAASLTGVTTASASEEPTVITIAYWNGDECFAGDDVLTAIEEKLNIKIESVNITWDDYTQKIQLWASSGSLPDVFVGDFRNTATYTEWATQGVIMEIPEDLSAYPNLEAYMSDEAVTGNAKVEGALYCIPRKSYESQEWTAMDREIAYRWDLAQAAGITEEPTTWEEFDAMIQAIIAADPDGTGVQGMTSTTTGLFACMFLPYASSIICDSGTAYKWMLDEEDGLYKPAYFTVDVLPAFQLMRDMYDDGTIEQDIALTNNQTAREKFLQGKSAAILFAGGAAGDNYNNIAQYWEDVHGSSYLDDVKVLNLMPDVNGNATYPAIGYAWSESYISSSVDDAKLEKILELYDYLLSDEGALLANYGPEGELYDLVDGEVVLHDDVNVSETYPSTGAFAFLVQWFYDGEVSSSVAEYEAINEALVAQAAAVELPEYNSECEELVKSLGISFAVDSENDVLTIMTGTDSVEDMWNEIYAGYVKDGLEDVISQVNEALAE